jgi:hypothetical protein
MKTIIHVNQHIIKKNKKTKTRTAPLTVKNYKQNRYAKIVKILGPSKLIYSPDKPLSCGATCYIVTESDVILG